MFSEHNYLYNMLTLLVKHNFSLNKLQKVLIIISVTLPMVLHSQSQARVKEEGCVRSLLANIKLVIKSNIDYL